MSVEVNRLTSTESESSGAE